ncbi:MAG: ABC-type transport auxiliary lipoprotein family protein [Acetobacteraceae bacterium]|nr:ABC-type transport auxiliary lipoprotein family protein [Acetobacteraceae bacterium]
MRRRTLLGGAVALFGGSVGGCSVLPSQPYVQRRDWPLAVRRGEARGPRIGGRMLLVRSVTAAPGLEARGVQWLLPDGSVHVDYYEQWAVPPAQAVEDDLRQWLADAGLFAAVVGPGSRINADLVLEGELTALVGDLQAGVARASLALVLLDQHPNPAKVLLQQTATATVPLASNEPKAVVAALQAAVAAVLRQAEATVAGALPLRTDGRPA